MRPSLCIDITVSAVCSGLILPLFAKPYLAPVCLSAAKLYHWLETRFGGKMPIVLIYAATGTTEANSLAGNGETMRQSVLMEARSESQCNTDVNSLIFPLITLMLYLVTAIRF